MAEMRYRDALGAALREELRRDERVVLMGEDIRSKSKSEVRGQIAEGKSAGPKPHRFNLCN